MAPHGRRWQHEQKETPSVNGKSPAAQFVVVASLFAALALATLVGCGTPQFEPENRHLLEALQTAVISKNTEWLKAVNKQVQDQHDKHSLSDTEFKAVSAVIDSAQAGDWKTAESRVFALSEGQRPTAADVARVRNRQAASK
jgi:hypothetical protein